MKTLGRLLEPIKYFKLDYAWYILSATWFGAFRPIMALILSKVVKGLETKDFSFFKTYMFIFLGLTTINYVINYFFRTSRRITIRLFQDKIYNTYLTKYLKADNNKIETLGTGQSNSIIQKGCDSRKDILHNILISSVMSNVIKIITLLVIIITNLGRIMTGYIIALFVMIILFARRGNKKMKPLRESRRDLFIQTDRFFIKLIMSKFEILQNNKIIKELQKAKRYFQELIGRDIKESKGFIIASDLPRAILDFAKAGILFRYGIKIFQGTAGLAEFTLIWSILNQITGTLFELNDIMLNYFGQIPFVEKLRKTFDEIPELKGYEEGKNFSLHTGEIILDNVSFNYGEKNVFQKFSLKIQGGQKTAFVGESGSGKTTLLKLMSGFIHPDTGSISIDNQALSTVALKDYYKHIGYLTQDPNVFDGTIRDNLLYGTTKKPTKKQIDEAIKLSRCEFIHTFKDGLETQIGEKGVRLSGGQKQRLAIAKLFLKNPKIIFLDEPTSSLDSFSEEDISLAFGNLFKGRTVIVVAHRLQTVKQADIIHALNKQGKIVESGSHQELLKKKGIYYKMIELQSGF